MPVKVLSAVFALLVAAAGWYYMFYSSAARRLADVEDQRLNDRRVRLRRIGGLVMMLLGICFFMLFWTFNPRDSAAAFLLMLLAVMVLLMTVVVLALIDVRLTYRLRNRKKQDLR